MKLRRAGVEEAEKILYMQIESFQELLDKYQDYDTNPASEDIDIVKQRLNQNYTYFYIITDNKEEVGAIRVVDKKDGSRKRISPLFILPQYRNKGLAQKVLQEVERMHGMKHWQLNTILEEEGNCYLYEKQGYIQDGNRQMINEGMTLVDYIKD